MDAILIRDLDRDDINKFYQSLVSLCENCTPSRSPMADAFRGDNFSLKFSIESVKSFSFNDFNEDRFTLHLVCLENISVRISTEIVVKHLKFLLCYLSEAIFSMTFDNSIIECLRCFTKHKIRCDEAFHALVARYIEIADICNIFDTVFYLSKIKKKINPDKSMIDLVFGKLKINALHFYAYLGYHKLLEEALDIGADIRVDEDGNSPLFYALDRKSQDCVDCILQFMIKLNDIDINRFLNYGYALRNDFDLLLNNGSELLPDFLEAIFYKLSNAISFAVPKVSLPCLIYTEADELNPYDFVFKRTELEEITGEVPVQFKALPFPICYQKGSSGSLALLKCILNCSNSLVLETEVVATFIKNKWDDL